MARRDEKFRAIDKAIGREGWKIVALLRLSPLIPFSASNYFYGITAVKFWAYVLASWIGMLPGTVLYVYLGTIGKAGLGGGDKASSPLEYVFLGVGLVANRLSYRRDCDRHTAGEESAEEDRRDEAGSRRHRRRRRGRDVPRARRRSSRRWKVAAR